MATDAIRLANEIGQDIMADYPGVVALDSPHRGDEGRVIHGVSIGTSESGFGNSVYIFAPDDYMVRFYVRREYVEPFLTPVLTGPAAAYAKNHENLKVHPEEPWMSLVANGGFLRISMDRLEYVLNKQRYMRMLRFVIDAEKMCMMDLDDFEGEDNLMMLSDDDDEEEVGEA